jgi:hypothetical protein
MFFITYKHIRLTFTDNNYHTLVNWKYSNIPNFFNSGNWACTFYDYQQSDIYPLYVLGGNNQRNTQGNNVPIPVVVNYSSVYGRSPSSTKYYDVKKLLEYTGKYYKGYKPVIFGECKYELAMEKRTWGLCVVDSSEIYSYFTKIKDHLIFVSGNLMSSNLDLFICLIPMNKPFILKINDTNVYIECTNDGLISKFDITKNQINEIIENNRVIHITLI